MKKVLKWIAIVFCGMELIAFVIISFMEDIDFRPAAIIIALVMALCLFLLLRKKRPKECSQAILDSGTERKNHTVKNTLKWIAIVFCGIAFATIIFTEDIDSRPAAIIIALVMALCLFLLLRKKRPNPAISSNPNADRAIKSMKSSLAIEQGKDQLRILRDCLNIIEKTKNLDTFFERCDLGMQVALTLTQAQKAGVVQNTENLVAEFLNAVEDEKDRVLCDSFWDQKSKVEKLSTPETKSKHWKRYLDLLIKYEDQYSDEYENEYQDVIAQVLKEISNTGVSISPVKLNQVQQADIQTNDIPDDITLVNISENFHIPENMISLLWFLNGPLCNCSEAEANEPSAIDFNLPISLPVNNDDRTSDIGYYPSYAKLSPRQKAVYLEWLCDVTQKIPIGYVFIFYYGLERFLFSEKHEDALRMIAVLRQHHTNASFLSYSADAMLIGCLMNNRPDLLQHIDITKTSQQLYLYIKGNLLGGFSPADLMNSCRMWGFTNTRYIKNERTLFEVQLEAQIQQTFGQSLFPVSHSDFMQSPKNFPIVIANYSLSLEARFASGRDITANQAIATSILKLLQNTHQIVKQMLAESRKKTK